MAKPVPLRMKLKSADEAMDVVAGKDELLRKLREELLEVRAEMDVQVRKRALHGP